MAELTNASLVNIGIQCLNAHNVDIANFTLRIFQSYQRGDSTRVNPAYIWAIYPYGQYNVYYDISGHYAQSIYLKCSVNLQDWVTIFSDTDH